MSAERVLTVRVSLKGRPLKTYRFTKDEITLGRNPESDIFLDNQGISRSHARLQRTPTGLYEIVDEGSANGTLVNEASVQKATLLQDDIVQVGKFTLWIGYLTDQREQASRGDSAISPKTYEGTTVLSTKELDGMLARARAERVDPHSEEEPAAVPRLVPQPATVASPLPGRLARGPMIGALIGAFVLGGVVGAAVLWLLIR